jgi:dipeptidyl aminopeptidase/acylaminoacyl peptidase
MRIRTPLLAAVVLLCTAPPVLEGQSRRPIDIPDLFRQATIGQVTVSPDGRRVLYTFTPGSYPAPSRDQQIHLATLDGSQDRPMTRAPGAQNQGAQWHPSGEFFGFTSTRGEEGRQVYLMWPDGGEGRRVTSAEGGVSSWGWSHDGSHLAWLSGRGAEAQLWIMDGRGEGVPRQLTRHPTPVSSFQWATNRNEILFLAPDAWDAGEFQRREAGYEARPLQRGLVFPDFIHLYAEHLWQVGVAGGEARRITRGDDLIVNSFRESPEGDRIALVVGPRNPHVDNRPNEIHLVDPATGAMERLTRNDVGESIVGFSPDGSMLAITAPKDFAGSGINDVFVRPVAGGDWRAVTGEYDSEVSDVVWAASGDRLHFVGSDGVNLNLYEAGIRDGSVRRVTELTGVASIADGTHGEMAVLGFSDPTAPEDLYAVPWNRLGDRSRWTRLTRANPWVEGIELARTEAVRWRSPDGTEVEGLLVYPLDHDPSRRYPLITEIHGGPASAFTNSFLPTAAAPHRAYGHLLAARGYAFLLPNYRGSSNYGHRFRTEISGDYWTRATEDIHAGIDHVIEMGLAHPDSLGFMGWSAGGHWSNWMLVTTDRFKAIASGAGVANWISLYAQTDNQSSREFYLGRNPALDAPNKPWDDFDHWWNESPLKYIENARTPTLLHYGQLDQRIPMPQGQELHLALKSRGVPTEFFVYPGEDHALRQPRNKLVKLMADLGWFEKWIRGEESWFEWDRVLEMGKRIEAELAESR